MVFAPASDIEMSEVTFPIVVSLLFVALLPLGDGRFTNSSVRPRSAGGDGMWSVESRRLRSFPCCGLGRL